MASHAIDYFELPVRSARESSTFFTQVFGFGAQAFGDSYIEIREGGTLGAVYDGADRAAAPLVGIRTDDIAETERAIVAAGGTITRATYDYPGGKRFYFREPGGVELVVYQPQD